MERLRGYWDSFKDVAIVFSFVVNFVLVVLVVALSVPAARTALALKSGTVEPLLDNLDAAFVGLGQANIRTDIEVQDTVPIEFGLDLDQQLPVNFDLLIEQDTDVWLTEAVPLRELDATFVLPGGGGEIRGKVTLSLPEGQRLPIRLRMVVPVSQTIPVSMTVPVDQMIPITMTVPVDIRLGEAGLAPAVEDLRAAFRPLREQIEALPGGP